MQLLAQKSIGKIIQKMIAKWISMAIADKYDYTGYNMITMILRRYQYEYI